MPGRADLLAETIRSASRSKDDAIVERAVHAAGEVSLERALSSYSTLMRGLLQGEQGEQMP
jgi:precorrin isomerase